MKIATVINNLCYPDAVGGAELVAFKMVEELEKKRHEIYLLAYSEKKLHGHMSVRSFLY